MDDEKKLAENVLNGDVEAFSVLVNRYQSRLFKFLLGLTFCREDAEEILQDVFIRAYNYLHKYNSKWSFSTWIYKISVNTFKDFYKHKKKRDFIDYYDDLTFYSAESNDNLELAYESKELYAQVVRLIKNLKTDQRTALVLKCVQGFTYEEIARIMGISIETAKINVYRARQIIGDGLRKARCV